MRIIGVFRNIPAFTVVVLPPTAVRRRCRSCCWINLFEPFDVQTAVA